MNTTTIHRVIAAAAGSALALGAIAAAPAVHAAPGKAHQSQGAVHSAKGQAKAVAQQVRALVAHLGRDAARYESFATEFDAIAPTLPVDEQLAAAVAAATLRQLAADARELGVQVGTATSKGQVFSYRKDRVAIVKLAGPVIDVLEDLRPAA